MSHGLIALVDSKDRARLTEEIVAGLNKGIDFGSEFQIAPFCGSEMRFLQMCFKVRSSEEKA